MTSGTVPTLTLEGRAALALGHPLRRRRLALVDLVEHDPVVCQASSLLLEALPLAEADGVSAPASLPRLRELVRSSRLRSRVCG